MPETVEVNICFVSTLQPRRELPNTERGCVLQLHGQPTIISIPDVPKEALVNGVPSAAVLWQAEAVFLERQGEIYPEHHVIAWEAHHQNPNGPLLSQFRVVLPAQED